MSEIEPNSTGSAEFRWEMTDRESDEPADFPVVKNLGPDPSSPGEDIIEVNGQPIIQ